MILLASLYKQYNYHKRYLVNTLFSIVLYTVIFVALIYGYSALSATPLQYGSTVSGLIISYYAWTLMMSVYTFTGYVVEQNKNNGTLENIIVSSQSITLVLICECIANCLFYFVFSWAIIGLLALICGVSLHVHVVTTFVILMVGLLSVLGMSLVVAGLEMLLRKMDSIMTLLQFALLGELFLPDSVPARLLLPFHFANHLLRRTFLDDCTLSSFSGKDYLYLALNSAIYLLLGVLCFSQALKLAKRKGTLSFY